jgi:predicted transglutaminase-like cysteine proteinase
MQLPNARSIDPVVDEMFPRWPAVRIYLANEAHAPDGAMRELAGWAQSLRGEPELQRLREINDRVNGLLSYDTDAKLWHETDYWESPGEALSRGAADCEGFAIFKMYLAKEAGIPLEQTAILVGTLGSAREPHAILGARIGPNIVTLDNKSGSIVTLGGRDDFTPLFSVGVRGAYTYPLNWGSGSDVETAQASDESAARAVTASRQAADDALTVLRPAAASAAEPAEPALDALAAKPAAAAPAPAVELAAVDLPPLPPLKPEPPRKAAYTVADAEAVPSHSAAPKKTLFGGGALDQVLNFVFQ